MQLNYLFALITFLAFHALSAPIDTVVVVTHSNHVQPSSVSSVPSTTLGDAGYQPSITRTPFTTNVTTAVEEATGTLGTDPTTTAAPAQPTFVPRNSGQTPFQAVNVAVTATGLPIAGVMLYLAWIMFVRAHNTQEERSDPEDDSGEDATGSGEGVNEDVELVELEA